jgi:hypothetical protein
MKRLLVVAITAALIQPATAQVTGNTWEANCASQELHDYVACRRYVAGVADTLRVWEASSPSTLEACIPDKATVGQLVEVGRKFMRDNPSGRHLPAGVLLVTAFTFAWPCKR